MATSIFSSLGKFAEGLATGYSKAMKDRREQEVHDAQMQKIRDDQAMTKEIKLLADTKAAATDAYTVVDPDGNKVVYADAAAAHDAAAHNPGAEVQRKILVAGKQYDTPEDAQAAVEVANSPLAKTRMAAQIALKYNRPDVYDAHMKAYKIGVDANRQDAQQAVLNARESGSLEDLAKVYNDRLPNGQHVKLELGEDGKVVKTLFKGDKVISSSPAGSPKDVWDGALAYAAATPDNALEIWKHSSNVDFQNKHLGLETKRTDAAVRSSDANVAKTDAEVKEMPERLALLGRQVGATEKGAQASLTSAGASVIGANAAVVNAQTGQAHLTAPVLKEGLDAKGNLAYGVISPRFDPKTGQWGAPVIADVPVSAGLKMKPKPVDAVTANLLGGGGGLLPGNLGAGPAAPLTGAALADAIRNALPPKNPALTPPPRPLGGGLNTSFPPAQQ